MTFLFEPGRSQSAVHAVTSPLKPTQNVRPPWCQMAKQTRHGRVARRNRP